MKIAIFSESPENEEAIRRAFRAESVNNLKGADEGVEFERCDFKCS